MLSPPTGAAPAASNQGQVQRCVARTLDPAGDPVHADYKLRIPAPDLDGRIYTFEFWDTLRGEPVRLIDARVRDGAAEATIPPFARDIAAKIRLRP